MTFPILVDGGFDPFHPGHVRYLQAARELAGPHRLIAGVASDAWIATKHAPLLSQRDRAVLLAPYVDDVICYGEDETTPSVIERLRPLLYIKGDDWKGRLPMDHIAACLNVGCEIRYVDTVTHSSSFLLSEWIEREQQAAFVRFSLTAALQRVFGEDTFTAEYFAQQGFTLEERRNKEGNHPKILAALFKDLTVLDYGCGPGHFVTMLKDEGMDVHGYDPHVDGWMNDPQEADVVVCREVLEHVPIREYFSVVTDLVLYSRRFVYVTARFHEDPMSVFDVQTSDDLDPTHISRVHPLWLRSLFVAAGMHRRKDLEDQIDHQQQGRVLVYEHARD